MGARDNLRARGRGLLTTTIVAILTVASGCREPDAFEGVYEEETPIQDPTRDYAYRMTVLQYADEVGGVINFYSLDGTIARLDRPFTTDPDCRYFGPTPLDRDTFEFELPNGPSGETFRFRIESLNPETATARFWRSFEGNETDGTTIRLLRTDTTTNTDCSPVGALETEATWPLFTDGEARHLSLAILFSGYVVTSNEGRREIVRRNAAVHRVPHSDLDPDQYLTSELVSFPLTVNEGWLSDPVDGRPQYGIAYLVLFDDGNGDFILSTDDANDRILALSPDRVVVYIDGPPRELAQSVQDAFDEIEEVQNGYGLYYRASDYVHDDDAFLLTLVRLSPDYGIRLSRIRPDNPIAFPVLLP